MLMTCRRCLVKHLEPRNPPREPVTDQVHRVTPVSPGRCLWPRPTPVWHFASRCLPRDRVVASTDRSRDVGIRTSPTTGGDCACGPDSAVPDRELTQGRRTSRRRAEGEAARRAPVKFYGCAPPGLRPNAVQHRTGTATRFRLTPQPPLPCATLCQLDSEAHSRLIGGSFPVDRRGSDARFHRPSQAHAASSEELPRPARPRARRMTCAMVLVGEPGGLCADAPDGLVRRGMVTVDRPPIARTTLPSSLCRPVACVRARRGL